MLGQARLRSFGRDERTLDIASFARTQSVTFGQARIANERANTETLLKALTHTRGGVYACLILSTCFVRSFIHIFT